MFLVSSCSGLCPIRWSQVLSWEWRCSWSSADRRCSNYIWVINNFIAYKGATYFRCLTVVWIYLDIGNVESPSVDCGNEKPSLHFTGCGTAVLSINFNWDILDCRIAWLWYLLGRDKEVLLMEIGPDFIGNESAKNTPVRGLSSIDGNRSWLHRKWISKKNASPWS